MNIQKLRDQARDLNHLYNLQILITGFKPTTPLQTALLYANAEHNILKDTIEIFSIDTRTFNLYDLIWNQELANTHLFIPMNIREEYEVTLIKITDTSKIITLPMENHYLYNWSNEDETPTQTPKIYLSDPQLEEKTKQLFQTWEIK